jgi:hypothetical protein
MSSIANALETLVYNGLSAEDVLQRLSMTPNKIQRYRDDLGYEWLYILSGRAVHHLLAKNEHMEKYVVIHTLRNCYK